MNALRPILLLLLVLLPLTFAACHEPASTTASRYPQDSNSPYRGLEPSTGGAPRDFQNRQPVQKEYTYDKP